MPQLDVSFMCSDPMLADRFDLTRRWAAVGADGRVQITRQLVRRGLMGVVTQQDPSDAMKREEGVVVPRRIFVATRIQVLNACEGYLADIITWNGDQYLVDSALPYSRFGRGFYEVVASAFSKTNPPQ